MPVTEARLTATSDIRRIVQGENLTLTVEIYDEVAGRALNLTGATAATAKLPGTTTTVTKLLGAGVTITTEPGRLTVHLSTTDTAALKVGDGQAWQLAMTLADGSIRMVQLADALDVLASLF